MNEIIEEAKHYGEYNRNYDIDRFPLLTIVCAQNNYDFVKFFLYEEINVNTSTIDGITPLMVASSLGNKNILLLLLEYGAKVDLVDNLGNSALIYASTNNHVDIVKILVSWKADVNIKNKRGESALSVSNNVEIYNFLVSKGATIGEC